MMYQKRTDALKNPRNENKKSTKIYTRYTFEQGCFKKRDFVLMNQKSRQNAKNAIEENL